MKLAPQNSHAKAFALRTAQALYVPNPVQFIESLPVKKVTALAHFAVACESHDLPLLWGDEQISAYLPFLHAQYYSASYIESHWYTLKDIGKMKGLEYKPFHTMIFQLLKKNCRSVKDNKVHVSGRLLWQLCQAADLLFTSYTAKLAKAIFVTAFSFSLRISEYTNSARRGCLSHNLRRNALLMSPNVFTCHFFSDKTSMFSSSPKHRSVPWRKLPPFVKPYVLDFMQIRPASAPKFFCKLDGSPLSRPYFINLLDSCVLLTQYWALRITPHSFRLSAPSEKTLVGTDMKNIHFDGRWEPNSKAIESYTHPDLVDMHLTKCLKTYPGTDVPGH